MISIPGSLSFANLVMMSSTPGKLNLRGMPDMHPKIHSFVDLLSNTISTPICIRSAFFLRQTQQTLIRKISRGNIFSRSGIFGKFLKILIIIVLSGSSSQLILIFLYPDYFADH